MAHQRLSALDASFLEVESPTAHMHVGWAALFASHPGRGKPSFGELREHIVGRLARAPRYRQKLAFAPLGVTSPVWVDDECFELDRHVLHSAATDFKTVVDAVMSEPLDRDRPLWQLWVADQLGDGRLGVVGKAHHSMVDGLAAVELAGMLLDPSPDSAPVTSPAWQPRARPGSVELVATGVGEGFRLAGRLARAPARLARRPWKLAAAPGALAGVARALADAARPSKPTALNAPISSDRHLAAVVRPLADLQRIKRHFGTTVNDVLLAASTGALRNLLGARGASPPRLKTMVPVSLRDASGATELGNGISFVFVDLPCDEHDPVRRLRELHAAMSDRKAMHEPEAADELLKAIGYAPPPVRRVASRLVASPRTFNLTVSNIPGPAEPMYMLGCVLEHAFPVVPIADRHDLSIGMTTIGDDACFGIYSDGRRALEAEGVAYGIDQAIEELLERCGEDPAPSPSRVVVGAT